MKITKNQLKRIIQEELQTVLTELRPRREPRLRVQSKSPVITGEIPVPQTTQIHRGARDEVTGVTSVERQQSYVPDVAKQNVSSIARANFRAIGPPDTAEETGYDRPHTKKEIATHDYQLAPDETTSIETGQIGSTWPHQTPAEPGIDIPLSEDLQYLAQEVYKRFLRGK